MLGSLAMGINFPDLHCRLALEGLPAKPESRTGFWLDTHGLLASPRNTAQIITRDPGFLRYIDWDVVRADPRLDSYIAYRTLRLSLTKAIRSARQRSRAR